MYVSKQQHLFYFNNLESVTKYTVKHEYYEHV